MQPRLRHTALINRGRDPASGVELPLYAVVFSFMDFNLGGIILRVRRRLRSKPDHSIPIIYIHLESLEFSG
jgi:hypothetical protein